MAAASAQLRAISLEYSPEDLRVATSGWHASKKLGSGCYGAVYRGEMKDGSEVAIKAIDLGALMGKGESPEDAGFDEEVQMLSKFRHPNLVTLLGWGQKGLLRYLVYEFLAGGDVFQRLHKSRAAKTDKLFLWHERLSVALDAATGLSHMHNSTPKAFHRDIKSANILLDRHGAAKMADFGLSCTSGQTGALHITVKTISGTPGYKCPIYERTGRFTEGSEVYSFGMVLLEVLTGLDPSSADPKRPGQIVFPVADVLAPGRPGALERCGGNLDASAGWPAPLAQEFGALALRCVTAHEERSRPLFVEIVRSLRGMLERFPPSYQPKAPAAKAKETPPAPHLPPSVGHSVLLRAAPAPALSLPDPAEQCPYQFELVLAAGTDAGALPPSLRQLPLAVAQASDDSPANRRGAPVGRGHQPELFEAWLPDLGQRSCISRTALELQWSPGSDNVWLLACGTNPLSVDGKVVTRNVKVPVRVGSEVCFTYELKVLLRLRLTSTAAPDTARRVLPAPEKVASTPQSPTARWSVERTYQLACSSLDVRVLGRVMLLENVASVSDAVEQLNTGSIRSPGGFCIVYSATKSAYFLLYQPGFREAAFASLGVTAEEAAARSPSSVVSPKGQAAAGTQPLLRMESAAARGDPATASTSAGSGGSSGAASSSAAPAWRLVCVHAEGLGPEDLAALPPDLREFGVPEGAAQVGRHHQPQHFEAWLPDPILRFCVSRTHLDLAASSVGLLLTNRSSNLLSVDQEPVAKGETKVLAVGKTVSFARLGGQSPVPFLTLQLRSAEASGLEERCPPAPPLGARAQAPRVVCAATSVDLTQPIAVTKSRAGIVSPSQPTFRAPRPSQDVRSARSSLGAASTSVGAEPRIVLELWGEGTQDVPLSCRTIGPVSLGERPLLVGRRHQPDLHQRAVSEECLESLGRDHFCVAFEGSEYWLLALTPHRIWRHRDGEAPVQLARDDLVTLLPGDRIALGTGDATTAETARRRLCWHFRKVDECPSIRQPSPRRSVPAPAPPAHHPPRWLSVAAGSGSHVSAAACRTAVAQS